MSSLNPGENYQITRVQPYRDGWYAQVPYPTDPDTNQPTGGDRDLVSECPTCSALVAVASAAAHQSWHAPQ